MSLSVANDWFLGSKPIVCRYVTTSYMGANYLCIYMHFWVMQIYRLSYWFWTVWTDWTVIS